MRSARDAHGVGDVGATSYPSSRILRCAAVIAFGKGGRFVIAFEKGGQFVLYGIRAGHDETLGEKNV